MSIAMMSAPSSASRTACARPCPRAAPVMKATLPATRPAMLCTTSLLVGEPRVDRQRHAGDVTGVVGHQPQDRVGDVHRPELGYPGLEGAAQAGLVPHVGLPGDDPPVQRLNLLDRLG